MALLTTIKTCGPQTSWLLGWGWLLCSLDQEDRNQLVAFLIQEYGHLP